MSAQDNNSPRINQEENNHDLNNLLILASAAAGAPLRNLNLLEYLYANSVPLYYGGGGAGDGGGEAGDSIASILARSLYDRCPVKKVITEEAVSDIIDKNFTAAMVEELKINGACGIWQEDFEEGEAIKILPCNHAFKAEAILKWLNEEKAECPICRFSLQSKEVIDDQQNSLHPPSEHQHPDANAQENESDIVRVNNIASRLAESVAGNVNPNFHRDHHQQHQRAISVPMNQLLQSMRVMTSSLRSREPVRAAIPSSSGAAAPVSQSSYAAAGREVRAEAVQYGWSRLNNGNAVANNIIYINNNNFINYDANNYNNNNNNRDNNRDEDYESSDDDDENILMMNQEQADIEEAIRRSLQ